MDLRISRAHLDAITAHAHAQSPHECCGLLLGDMETGTVHEVRPTPNVAAHPQHRFEIDPAALLAAYKSARTGGPGMIGHYHSHPHSSAEPSRTDADMAEKRGEYWLILGQDGTVTAWRAEPGGSLHDCFTAVAIRSRVP